MNKVTIFFISFVLLFIILGSITVEAKDTLRIRKPLSEMDLRHQYGKELLQMILDATAEEYGEYEIINSKYAMQRDRMLVEMIEGQRLNVAFEAVKPEWEQKLIPVRIPIRKGLQGYRLFFIKEQNQALLEHVESLEQLKQIPTGSGTQWSTTKIYKESNFSLVTEIEYEHLFKLLMNDRFMTFGRGVNEIYDEYEARKDIYPDLVIEKYLLLYFPLAEYYFVSPKVPELAKRIEKGFNKIIDDGSFDKFFKDKYGDLIEKANLKGRRIFKINNPNLSDKTPFAEEQYWFKP